LSSVGESKPIPAIFPQCAASTPIGTDSENPVAIIGAEILFIFRRLGTSATTWLFFREIIWRQSLKIARIQVIDLYNKFLARPARFERATTWFEVRPDGKVGILAICK
jgi:hypothetical protein